MKKESKLMKIEYEDTFTNIDKQDIREKLRKIIVTRPKENTITPTTS